MSETPFSGLAPPSGAQPSGQSVQSSANSKNDNQYGEFLTGVIRKIRSTLSLKLPDVSGSAPPGSDQEITTPSPKPRTPKSPRPPLPQVLSPIHKLPPEIIALIFQTVQAHERHGNTAYPAIKTLAQVSTTWYSIVLSTPQLWTLVEDYFHPTFAKTIIRLSKGLLLNIYFRSPTPEDIFDLLLPHADRWGRVEVMTKKALNFLNDNMQWIELPRLHSFVVFISPPQLDTGIPLVVQQRAPRLHELRITPILLPLQSPVLSNLRSLEFTSAHQDVELSPGQWQKLLTMAPQLESIHARGRQGMAERDETFPTSAIDLPKLHHLQLSYQSMRTIEGLLSSIRPAADRPLRFSVDFPAGNAKVDSLFLIRAQLNTFLSLLPSMTWLSVQSELDNIGITVISAGGAPGTWSFLLRVHNSKIQMGELFRLIASPASEQLESLRLEGSQVLGGLTETQTIPNFPNLKKLVLINPSSVAADQRNELTSMLSTLSLRTAEQDGKVDWWFPRLNHLVIAAYSASRVFDMIPLLLHSRYHHHLTSGINSPAPLEVLQLTNLLSSGTNVIDPALTSQLSHLLKAQGTKLELDQPVKGQLGSILFP
ncbi:hypothetical protein FRC02_010040 [Tulasnella sp. 418]|nr:hypothetical protein FRC02_010040 [Tulasnella sp. 418]